MWLRNSIGALWTTRGDVTATVWRGAMGGWRFLVLKRGRRVSYLSGFPDEPQAMAEAERVLDALRKTKAP